MLDSLYTYYSVPGTRLLRENYPDDGAYKATYLAGESAANEFSYLWPFSGTLSAVAALVETEGWERFGPLLDSVVLPGLAGVCPTTGDDLSPMPPISVPLRPRTVSTTTISGSGSTSPISTPQPASGVSSTRRSASGSSSPAGPTTGWAAASIGASRKRSKNTCSNAPGAVLALKLYLATGREEYLEQGRALYEWTRKRLLDRSDDLYFDNISLKGAVNKAKFSYNSGQMIQAGALLHRITGKKTLSRRSSADRRGLPDPFFPARSQTGRRFRPDSAAR